MFQFILRSALFSLLCAFGPAELGAQSLPANKCVKFIPNKEPTVSSVVGWIENICDKEIIAFDVAFDLDDDSETNGSWCQGLGGGDWHLPSGSLLDPGERSGVGWDLYGQAKSINWAACSADTSLNNSVNFLVSKPLLRFDADCKYECM